MVLIKLQEFSSVSVNKHTMPLNGGAPVTAVKDMLRHASIKQTTIYVHTMNRVKRAGSDLLRSIKHCD